MSRGIGYTHTHTHTHTQRARGIIEAAALERDLI